MAIASAAWAAGRRVRAPGLVALALSGAAFAASGHAALADAAGGLPARNRDDALARRVRAQLGLSAAVLALALLNRTLTPPILAGDGAAGRRLVVSVAAATLPTFGVLRLDVLVDDYREVSLRDVLTLSAG